MATFGGSNTIKDRKDQSNIESQIEEKLIGQKDFLKVADYIQMFEAGLSPEGQPVGSFLLTGPTGSGKTRAVEVVAEVLHMSNRHILRVDCGEYQMDHEVAKLVGAPPGYLGHRETQPLLSQARINSVASEHSNISVILFDEIDKAAPSLMRLLLGVMDRGILRLGDNNIVNLERCMIFMTSNFGSSTLSMTKVEGGKNIKAYLSPEFFNRCDETINFKVLDSDSIKMIAYLEVCKIQDHMDRRLGSRSCDLVIDDSFYKWVIQNYTDAEYGFRPIKRFIRKKLIHTISKMYIGNKISEGDCINITFDSKTKKLVLFIESD